jgi:BirA family biotin operon repressor/biotin-[acetyl-CoA-carboxylase] ligase
MVSKTALTERYAHNDYSDRLLPGSIKKGLKTQTVAKEIHYFQRIDSTNTFAKKLAVLGVSEGTLIIAEEQTKGRGRMDRYWISPPYCSILCSIIFYPSLKPTEVFRLTMLASVAVVRTIQKVCHIEAHIKWPNDVYVRNKKVCGILTEFLAHQECTQYAVVGVGLNVNFDPEHYPETVDSATSLQKEVSQKISRLGVLKKFLQELDHLYRNCLNAGADDLRGIWERYSMVLGKHVKIISGDEIIEGTAKGINRDGHLILIDGLGKRMEILSGDLSLSLT